MPEPVRIQVRCEEEVANKYSEAANAFGMTYAQFAWLASEYILENREDFERFTTKTERRREKRR